MGKRARIFGEAATEQQKRGANELAEIILRRKGMTTETIASHLGNNNPSHPNIRERIYK